MKLVGLFAGAAAVASAEVYFKDTFADGEAWTQRWVHSDNKVSSGEAGKFTLDAGAFYGDAEADKGIKTSEDARFYNIAAPLTTPFSNEGKDLVLQFSVKHAQNIDCGGGYIKLFPSGLDAAKMTGDSDYNIMFGPDICGSSNKKVHVIFNYKGKNHLIKKTIPCETDERTHVYTLVLKPDQTYEVRIDGDKKESGSLTEDWDFLEPKQIKDPAESKPKDWVNDAMIDDPEDVKPEGHDDIPKEIVDPEASKPDDWDDEDDGDWEAPMVPNPDFKGPWSAKRIDNPAYKGPWVHPMVDNPDYKADDSIYKFDNAFVGFDLWQVKAGTIFDNIIVTDDVAEAETLMAETFTKNKDAEKESLDAVKKAKADADEAARKAAEEAAKADDDDDDDDEEEEPAKHEEL
jgi:calreticulin